MEKHTAAGRTAFRQRNDRAGYGNDTAELWSVTGTGRNKFSFWPQVLPLVWLPRMAQAGRPFTAAAAMA
ncbi:hypothetical protein KLP40_01555 [Hymenobacter sp. NST-14]|uniref:hypothetical protein n=1 Tax=Hymenobacter piscis TaxID=2839984 RepID=UPI001C036250|nr:hypothetical protein [Hymenobacter piscis]MBT9391834.1 hypothetical protein [Hymenobacter piscis]